MPHSIRLRRLLVISLALGFIALLGPNAIAQDDGDTAATETGLKIGIIDFDALSEEYQTLSQKRAQLQEWSNVRRSMLEQLQNFVFLSAENFGEVIELLKAPAAERTEAQENRLQQLLELSEQKERRYLDLRSKTDRTTEEDDEFGTLGETIESRSQDIQQLAQQMEQDFQTRWGGVQQQLTEKVENIVKQVGENEGYDLLLDSTVVFFSSDNVEDVTEKVITALNAAESGEEENGGGD